MIGLVFLYSQHPLEQFLSSAFGFPFSSLGLIFNNSKSQAAKTGDQILYLIDVFGVYNSNNTRSPITETSLDRLAQDPLLSEVKIRWLQLPSAHEEKFRLTTCDLFAALQSPAMVDIVRELVGLRKHAFTLFEALLELLKMNNLFLSPWKIQLPQQTTNFSEDWTGACTFLGSLAQPFQTQDPRWRGLENLGQLEVLKLSAYNPVEKEQAAQSALKKSLPIFKELSNAFLNNFCNDAQFMLAALRKYQSQNLQTRLLILSLDLNTKMAASSSVKELEEYRTEVEDLLTQAKELGLFM